MQGTLELLHSGSQLLHAEQTFNTDNPCEQLEGGHCAHGKTLAFVSKHNYENFCWPGLWTALHTLPAGYTGAHAHTT